MGNGFFPRSPQARDNVANRPSRSYAGSYADRRSRFEVRTARRYGDWGILGIPTAALWFEEVELAAAADAEVDGWEPAIIDIWS
jgi:hypothetical protein